MYAYNDRTGRVITRDGDEYALTGHVNRLIGSYI